MILFDRARPVALRTIVEFFPFILYHETYAADSTRGPGIDRGLGRPEFAIPPNMAIASVDRCSVSADRHACQ